MNNLLVLLVIFCIHVMLSMQDDDLKKKDPFGMSVVDRAQNRRGKKPASVSKQQKLHDYIKNKEPSSQVEASNTSVKMITDEVLDPSPELGDHKENNILNTPTENVPTKNSDADYID